jgi:hypothetical protein
MYVKIKSAGTVIPKSNGKINIWRQRKKEAEH